MNYDDLAPNVRAMVDSADAKDQGKPDPHKPVPFENEAAFQKEAERFLERCGFRRRTPREIQRHHKGLWYIHLSEAKKNPILLDLLLIDSTEGAYKVRSMEIELKVEGGRLSVEQQCLTVRKEGVCVWDMAQFEDAFRLWRVAVNEGRAV
jgi:hypothetical protein